MTEAGGEVVKVTEENAEEEVQFLNHEKITPSDEKLPFSDNSFFDNLTNGDLTTEIVGYVDALHASKAVGQNKQYQLYKFGLNNDTGRRIDCCIWGSDLIPEYEPKMKLNMILHITAAQTKISKSYVSNPNHINYKPDAVPFEIVITESTCIEYYGKHTGATLMNIDPVKVDFENITDHDGQVVIVTGYLRQTLRVVVDRFKPMSHGSGAICNGEFKINLTVTNCTSAESIALGDNITVTGLLSVDGGLSKITCKDMTEITINKNVPKLSLKEVCKANKFPKRKNPE